MKNELLNLIFFLLLENDLNDFKFIKKYYFPLKNSSAITLVTSKTKLLCAQKMKI